VVSTYVGRERTASGGVRPSSVPGLTASQSSSDGQLAPSSAALTETASSMSGAALAIVCSEVNTGTYDVPSCSMTGREMEPSGRSVSP
jgi:hypothetical protein